MPTAVVDLVRECKYLVVVIRPRPVESSKCSTSLSARPWGGPGPDLPTRALDFASEGCVATPRAVGIRLHKDDQGRPDPMPLMAACDCLRDDGWDVEGWGWAEGFLAKGV